MLSCLGNTAPPLETLFKHYSHIESDVVIEDSWSPSTHLVVSCIVRWHTTSHQRLRPLLSETRARDGDDCRTSRSRCFNRTSDRQELGRTRLMPLACKKHSG